MRSLAEKTGQPSYADLLGMQVGRSAPRVQLYRQRTGAHPSRPSRVAALVIHRGSGQPII